MSPESTSTSSGAADGLPRAQRTASPVPSGAPARRPSTPVERSGACRARRRRRAGPAASGRAGLEHPVDHPAAEERMQVLGDAERMRVPSPPAITTAASCRRHHECDDGWGARIRTWDHGTKTRCLTTWPRPSASGVRSLARRGGPTAVEQRARRAPARRTRRRAATSEHHEHACEQRHEDDDELGHRGDPGRRRGRRRSRAHAPTPR